MKSLLLITAALAIACPPLAFASNGEAEQSCSGVAKTYLAKKMKVTEASIVFFNGAFVGDGINAIEIDTYRIGNGDGLYKVEYDAEMCEFRNFEFVNN